MGRKLSFTACFLLLMGEFAWARIDRHSDWYSYYMTIGIAIMVILCILLLYTQKSLKKLYLHLPVVILWAALTISMIISEIIVPKQFQGVGAFLFSMFILYFCLAKSPYSQMFYEGLIWAMKIGFAITTIYQLLFRQYYEGYRYSGFLVNPNVYGLFLLVIFCTLLGELMYIEVKKRWITAIGDFLGMGFCIFFILKTQARTSLLAAGCATVGVLITSLIIYIRTKEKNEILIKIGGICAALVICYPIGNLLLHYVPGTFVDVVEYKIDWDYLSEYDLAPWGTNKRVQQEGNIRTQQMNQPTTDNNDSSSPSSSTVPTPTPKPNHILSTLQGESADKISSGRLSIYNSYFNALKWSGHKYVSRKIEGKRVMHAHNNFLQFAYTYGISSGIFFVIFEVYLMIYAFIRCIKNGREDKMAFLSLAAAIGFVVATITECVFLPFQAFLALFFYLMSGRLFFKFK